MAEQDPVEVVLSVGVLDRVVVTLREFLHRSGALRAVAVVEGDPGEGPAVVDCARLAPVEVDRGGRLVHLPHAVELHAEPLPLPGDLRQLPPFEVDPAEGRVTSIIGGLHHAVDAVAGLAATLGGRSVALVQFPTLPVDGALAITCRADDSEPPLISLGDEEFELPEEPHD